MVPTFVPLSALGRLKIGFAVFIAVMILLLGSEAIYGNLAPDMERVLYIYLFMLILTLVYFPKREHKMPTIPAAFPVFMIAFLITLFLMLIVRSIPMMQGLLVVSTLEASIEFTAVFLIMHAGVKAYIEEEVFRARLSVILGEGGQAIAFGLFHFFVLYMLFGFTWMLLGALVWLTLLGYAWGRVEDWGGTPASTGSHFAYNLVVMGIGIFLIGGVVA